LRRIVDLGLPVFADMKFHDIPNTVAGAGGAGACVFQHSGVRRRGDDARGTRGGRARKSAPEDSGRHHLTSLDAADLAALCLQGTARERVVCSPEEIEAVRETCGKDFLIVTPGVRPEGAAVADQRRVSTPAEALRAGADILVIGRPITASMRPQLRGCGS
jgi:orotidine-5'-phosphate decarboxylase